MMLLRWCLQTLIPKPYLRRYLYQSPILSENPDETMCNPWKIIKQSLSISMHMGSFFFGVCRNYDGNDAARVLAPSHPQGVVLRRLAWPCQRNLQALQSSSCKDRQNKIAKNLEVARMVCSPRAGSLTERVSSCSLPPQQKAIPCSLCKPSTLT